MKPARDNLPRGMTPRCLCREGAAALLGVSALHFDKHVVPEVPPIEIGGRKVWYVKALERWLDQRAQLGEAPRLSDEWLGELGNRDRARPRR